VAAAGFAGAFTFQYSPRPGTPAAELAGQVPKPVVQERYERLIALQERISWDGNRALVGSSVEVLVSVGEGRKDVATGRVSGRARDGRLVHVATAGHEVAPGDTVTTTVSRAAPHHLVADGGIGDLRPWRGRTAHPAGPAAPALPLLTIGTRPSRG
jgi:tRNA-2-methylthio-N6-dimethylallyladenosine synthase